MAYNSQVAERIRNYFIQLPDLKIQEKKMFGGLAFMVNRKMCVNVSGENLMCRFDPDRSSEVSKKAGYLPMIMKGKEYKGYCYVKSEGFKHEKDFKFWMKLCLDFNEKERESVKRK